MDKIPTVTAQEKGIDFKRKRVYTKPEVTAVKNIYIAMLMKHRPARPLVGAVALKVAFRFPVTKTHKDGEYKITKPDTDNMLKLLKDCCTTCNYWSDDSQVCIELVTKRYMNDSGIYFLAEEINEPM